MNKMRREGKPFLESIVNGHFLFLNPKIDVQALDVKNEEILTLCLCFHKQRIPVRGD